MASKRGPLAASEARGQDGGMPPPKDAPADGLSGLVERVTFHNEDTGFAVLKVKVKGRRDLVAVVGLSY